MSTSKERPVHEIRLGRVKAAIWRNDTEVGIRYSVSITRLYRTEDSWESSMSFGRDELPLVSRVADLAMLWIYDQPVERANEDEAKSGNGKAKSSRTRSKAAAATA